MKTSTTTAAPIFTTGSSHISCAGSSNLIFSSAGNIGIGTSPPSSRMTIYSTGQVTLGNPNPSHKLDIQSERIKDLKIRFMGLLIESIRGGSIIDESFFYDMIEIFETCGGWNVDTVDDFKKMADLISGRKIPRNTVLQFNDIITDRIINTWGFDLHDVGEIFEKIDLEEK
jgi:hypothetical protein